MREEDITVEVEEMDEDEIQRSKEALIDESTAD